MTEVTPAQPQQPGHIDNKISSQRISGPANRLMMMVFVEYVFIHMVQGVPLKSPPLEMLGQFTWDLDLRLLKFNLFPCEGKNKT